MRCPLCNTWVKDKDDLQIHCIEGCNAVGNGDTHLTNARFGKLNLAVVQESGLPLLEYKQGLVRKALMIVSLS